MEFASLKIGNGIVYDLFFVHQDKLGNLCDGEYILPERAIGCPIKKGSYGEGDILVFRVPRSQPKEASIKAIGGSVCVGCSFSDSCKPHQTLLDIGTQLSFVFPPDDIEMSSPAETMSLITAEP